MQQVEIWHVCREGKEKEAASAEFQDKIIEVKYNQGQRYLGGYWGGGGVELGIVSSAKGGIVGGGGEDYWAVLQEVSVGRLYLP